MSGEVQQRLTYRVLSMSSSDLTTALALLGIEWPVTDADVHRAFRSRAALVHPDVHHHRSEKARREAERASQQLASARDTLIEHLRRDDQASREPPESGPRMRCPRCGMEFFASKSELSTCPRCSQRLRARAATEPRDPYSTYQSRPTEDREIVYGLSTWDRSRRRALGSLLRVLGTDFYFERDDLVAPKAIEQFVDAVIEIFDAVPSAIRRRNAVDDTEIVYALDPSFDDITAAVFMDALDIPYSREPDGLVVDKCYEDVVDRIVALLE